MRFFYFQGPNFGDALNSLVWSELLPDYFETGMRSSESNPRTFVGFGSILGHELPKGRKIVFSTGYAYGRPPDITSEFDVICVRGPLTASALGLPNPKAVTDGAALVRTLRIEPDNETTAISFMPHHRSEDRYAWKAVCDNKGIQYLSPAAPPRQLLSKIASTRLLITEAMHGAIVADALRVPWIPCRLYPHINAFKWRDWAASMDLSYRPHDIKPIYDDAYIAKRATEQLTSWRIGGFTRAAVWAYSRKQRLRTEAKSIDAFLDLQNRPPMLSDEATLDRRVDQLLTRLGLFREKYPPT